MRDKDTYNATLAERLYYWKTDKDGNFKGIGFNVVAYVELLKESGFFRFNQSLVRITDNLIEETDPGEIIDFIEDIFKDYSAKFNADKELGPEDFLKALYNNMEYLTRPKLLQRLRPLAEFEFCTDTRTIKRVFYSNGFIEIQADGLEYMPYSALKGVIWKGNILGRDFEQTDGETGNFERFIDNIAPGLARKKALCSLIGYLCHTYNERNPRAVLFTDTAISEDSEPNGRTGKTLLLRAIGQMLNAGDNSRVFCEINGKGFDLKNKHRYETAGIDTALIHINDTFRNFPFESLFNDISDGLPVDRKHEKPFTIRPKLAISTNRTIMIEGESAKARALVFELANHYTAAHTPFMEFGNWFFSEDWSPQEWARFDDFMLACMELYMRDGIHEAEAVNLNERTLYEHTSPEFVGFMDDLTGLDGKNSAGYSYTLSDNGFSTDQTLAIRAGDILLKRQLFEAYSAYSIDAKRSRYWTQAKCTKWARLYFATRLIIAREQRRHAGDVFEIESIPKPKQV